MNNVLERVARAICKADGWRYPEDTIYDNKTPRWELYTDEAIAALTAICDEIDEGGLLAARYEISKSTVRGDKVENAIKAYLQHIKSTTETQAGRKE